MRLNGVVFHQQPDPRKSPSSTATTESKYFQKEPVKATSSKTKEAGPSLPKEKDKGKETDRGRPSSLSDGGESCPCVRLSCFLIKEYFINRQAASIGIPRENAAAVAFLLPREESFIKFLLTRVQ